MKDEKFENEYMRYLRKTVSYNRITTAASERLEETYDRLGAQSTADESVFAEYVAQNGQNTYVRKSPGFVKPLLGGLTAVIACFLFLVILNTVNPTLSESIPVLGKAFQSFNNTFKQVNTNTKSPMGTNLDTYELSAVNLQMTPQAETDYSIEVNDIYSDGEYVHASMIMHMPAGTGEEYAYFFVEGTTFADGVECESGLFKEGGISRFEPGEAADTFVATIASKLPKAYEDSAEIDFDIALDSFYGIHLDDSIDTELRRAAAEKLGLSIENGEAADLPFLGLDVDIPAFTGEASVLIDISKNMDFNVSAEDNDGYKSYRIYHLKATPTYVTVKMDALRLNGKDPVLELYTQDGTRILRNPSLDNPIDDAIWENETVVAHEYGFDGMPSGTTSLTFRWTDNNQQAYVEFTVYLESKTAEATKFYEDENSPLYPFNSAKFSYGTWSVMNEYIESEHPSIESSGLDENERMRNFINLSEHWQNGFNLYDINIKNNDGSGYVDFRLGKQDGYRAVNIQILSGDRLIVSGDSFDGVKTTEYYLETGFFDEREESFDSDSTHYSLRLHYQNGAVTSEDKNITMKVFDKESNELLYEKTVEMTYTWIS